MPAVKETIEDVRQLESDKYKYGFTTEIEQERAPKGLSRRHRCASSRPRKEEPDWLLDWRLEAYRRC
jgi:Fe-S cluster assembly protein SufB